MTRAVVPVGQLLMRAPVVPVKLGQRYVLSSPPLEDNMERSP